MVSTHHQAQAAIGHAQGQEDPARPDMRDCPHSALLILLIYVMVDEASNRLKDESTDNNDADNGMTVAGRELSAR